MFTAVKRLLSPQFRLSEDFSGLNLPVMGQGQRYACLDHGRYCFDHDPRVLQREAFAIRDSHAEMASLISKALDGVVTAHEADETVPLRSITGCVAAHSTTEERTLGALGQTLLANSQAIFAHLSSPHAQVAYGIQAALQGRIPYFTRASWMPNMLYCENPASAEALAQTIAVASAHGITCDLNGRVTTYVDNKDAARALCVDYGAWVLNDSSASRISSLFQKHQIPYCWSFVARKTPHIEHQVILYVPKDHELSETTWRHMTELLWENRCMTLYTWLDHFRYL